MVLNGAPIQHIFPHTHRLAFVCALVNHTPLDAPPSTPEKNPTAVWYQDAGGDGWLYRWLQRKDWGFDLARLAIGIGGVSALWDGAVCRERGA